MPILDTRVFPHDAEIETTVAIVGSGAAGLALAREFVGSGTPVAILESGGIEPDASAQALCDAEIVGADYFPPTKARLRCFGGTTNVWNGLCRPLDPIDFAARPEIPGSGWPFDAASLEPYYRRAHVVCGLGPYDYHAASWCDGAIRPLPIREKEIRSAVFQLYPARFAAMFGDELRRAENITVYLHATAVEIETKPGAALITRLRVADRDGKRLWVRAQRFVLAAGGIENARLLLSSDAFHRNGLGNDFDLVGRYFMDHPKVWKGARVVFERALPEAGFYDYRVVDATRVQGVFVPTEEVLRAEGLPNFTICLDHASIADVSSAAAELRSLRRGFGHGQRIGEAAARITRAAAHIGGLAAALYRNATNPPSPTIFSTRYWCDCPPDPDSRVTLSDKRDALGQRRARIDWRLPADFARSMRRAHELLGTALAEAALGEMRINWRDDEDAAGLVENSFHHMGTTRMHHDPRHGVVDANGRVHGTANLYVTGSSVFPTYGHANPTLTIVALALRLADRLKQVLHPDTIQTSGLSLGATADVATVDIAPVDAAPIDIAGEPFPLPAAPEPPAPEERPLGVI